MLNTSVPPGVLVSIDSVRDLNCIPLSSNVVIRSTRFCMLLPSVFCQIFVGRFGVSFSPFERLFLGRFGFGQSCGLSVIA